MLTLAPLDLLTELNCYYQHRTASSETSCQANLYNNFVRHDLEHPGEFMLTANLAPAANYFSLAFKALSPGIVKIKNLKMLGTARRLYLVSLVIMLFFIFYHNSRTTADADPLRVKIIVS